MVSAKKGTLLIATLIWADGWCSAMRAVYAARARAVWCEAARVCVRRVCASKVQKRGVRVRDMLLIFVMEAHVRYVERHAAHACPSSLLSRPRPAHIYPPSSGLFAYFVSSPRAASRIFRRIMLGG